MQPVKLDLIIKPTLDTLFHIDYEWWKKEDKSPLTHLPPEVREQIEASDIDLDDDSRVDYVDPETAEVHSVNRIGLMLQQHHSQNDLLSEQVSLVDSVFRVLLMNGNTAMSVRQLAQRTGRDANTILRTIGGVRIYRGIRPYIEES